MKTKERKVIKNVGGRPGRTSGDFQVISGEIGRKFGSRIYERFGLNPFDQKKIHQLISVSTAL
jgi:hypothetical protein